ncbi:MAG: PilZ domain-containing protein [Phycisphaerales bacterium]|nr:MAG: PilZ domain-containing protein [Phycisphaerales bacterium]
MFGDSDYSIGPISRDDAFDLLQELEKSASEEMRQQRAHFRVVVKSTLILRPGNASERSKFEMEGVTGDLSEGGCQALFSTPIRVGDIYQLQFDREVLDLALTYARCVRCRVLRDDAFEVGFQFFKPIVLPERTLMQIAAKNAGEHL